MPSSYLPLQKTCEVYIIIHPKTCLDEETESPKSGNSLKATELALHQGGQPGSAAEVLNHFRAWKCGDS